MGTDNHEFVVEKVQSGRWQGGCTCGWKGQPRYAEAIAWYDMGRHVGAATGEESDNGK